VLLLDELTPGRSFRQVADQQELHRHPPIAGCGVEGGYEDGERGYQAKVVEGDATQEQGLRCGPLAEEPGAPLGPSQGQEQFASDAQEGLPQLAVHPLGQLEHQDQLGHQHQQADAMTTPAYPARPVL